MTNTQDIFGSLLENAMDFLNSSIKDIQERPKHSVINFYSAIELLLKARLVSEHWTLAVSRRKTPDWGKFVAGDFISVTIEEAQKLLEGVLSDGLKTQEMEAFEKIRIHRNKMVHFFHESQDPVKSEQIVEGVVKELLTGWYFLHGLINTRWSKEFSNYIDDFNELNEKFMRLNTFLKVIFEQNQGVIENAKAEGFLIQECPACNHTSLKVENNFDSLIRIKCIVCNFVEFAVRIKCSDCNKPVMFKENCVASCEQCGREIKSVDLFEALDGKFPSDPNDFHSHSSPPNCGDCGSYQTVAQIDETLYLCTECLAISSNLWSCEWCNEPSTREISDSFISGCSVCDGRAGWG